MPDRHLHAAREAQMAGRTDDAVAELRAHLEERPDDVRALDLLGSTLAAAERFEEADDAYTRAAAAAPGDPGILFRYANVLIRRGRRREGARTLRAAIDADPSRLRPLRQLATLSFELGDYESALEIMRQILNLRPRAADEHINLAQTLRALREFEEAEAAAQRAAELRPEMPEAWRTLGLVRLDKGDLEGAERALRQAASVAPDDPRPHVALARLYERARRRQDARRAAKQAIELGATTGAERVLGRLDILDGDARAADQRFSALLGSEQRPEERGHVLIERGKARDRLDRADEALADFLAGQALLAPPESAVHQQYAAFLDMLERCRDWPSEPIDWPTAPPPGDTHGAAPVFIVGFPRSGTTLTEQLLAAHPAFVTSDEQPILHHVVQDIAAREPGYPRAIALLSDDETARLRALYRAAAERLVPALAANPAARLVDKQPYSTPHLPCIRRLFPDARVIVVLRDPRDACLSLIMQDVAPNQRMISYTTLAAAADAYERMMAGYLNHRDRLGLAIHEVRYEDLLDNLEDHARRLIQFTGEPWSDAVLEYRAVAARRRSQINTHTVTEAVYTRARARWRRYAAAFDDATRRALHPFVHTFGYDAD